MGRFRISEDEDPPDSPFQSQHVYSGSEEEDERSGIWRGPLVPLMAYRPQQPNGTDGPPPQDERDLGGSPIQHPSVSIRRSSRRKPSDEHMVDNNSNDNGSYSIYDAPPKRARFVWFRVLAVVCVAHLMARYGPVAPPAETETDSWEDFWVRELRGLGRTLKMVGFTVPTYVLGWVYAGLYDDAMVYYHQYQQYSEEQAQLEFWSKCSLQVPELWNLEYTRDTKIEKDWYYIVGQSRAVQVTTEALDAWKQSAPLLLHFSGDRGVGKLELARQISHRLFGHCLNGKHVSGEDLFQGSSPVMLIQGRDFSVPLGDDKEPEDTTQSESWKRSFRNLRIRLYDSILSHAQQHPTGSAILVQHAEDMAEGLVASLVQDLVHPSRHSSTEEELAVMAFDYSGPKSLASRLNQACGKTVFMLTSTIGSKTILRNIRNSDGIANIHPLELELSLIYKMDIKFATISSTSSKKASPPYVDVGSKFHAVAPFFPIEASTLKLILAQKASRWTPELLQSTLGLKTLSLTKTALDVLLDPSRVEYLTENKKGTKEPLLDYSKTGAQMLKDGSPTMNAWQASVKRCLQGLSSKMAGVAENGHTNGGSETVALDYDAQKRLGILLVCAPNAIENDPDGMLVLSVRRQDCEQMCQLPSL